jgi:hypothetical protein
LVKRPEETDKKGEPEGIILDEVEPIEAGWDKHSISSRR